ncbi:MAG: hypothetical protein H6835_15160 [Planctomycetes bacterium]|nr:hypothetical protein [Planctomycetota bacterium]
MNWDTFRHWFVADAADLEIVVAHAARAERERLLAVLPTWGHHIAPPDPDENAPHFMVGTATVAIGPPRGDEVVLTLPARPLYYDEAGYRAVEALMARIAHVLGLPVRLAPTGAAADDWIAGYDPMVGAFERREPALQA